MRSYLPDLIWLISLSIMPSKSIYVVTNDKMFTLVYRWVIFYFMNAYIHIYTYTRLCVHTHICLCIYTHICMWWILRLFPSLGVGFPGGTAVKNLPAVQETWRHKFDPWVRKILWRRKWQPSAVTVPRKPHGQRCLTCSSPRGRKRIRHD